MFDYIMEEHKCPKCNILAPYYQTDQLIGISKHFYLGDHINLNNILNFEFEICDDCKPCNISIEGLGIVRNNTLVEIKELGYRFTKPKIDFNDPTIFPRYFNFFGRKIKIGEKKYYPQHQQFTQLERIIAKLPNIP